MADEKQAFLKLMLITKQELCYAMQGWYESLTADKNLQTNVPDRMFDLYIVKQLK